MEKTEDKRIQYADEEFDFESIMREFGSAGELSDSNYDYDAAVAIRIGDDEVDEIISASFDDSYAPKASRKKKAVSAVSSEEFGLNAEEIQKEFDSDELISDDGVIDPETIRAEFGAEEAPEEYDIAETEKPEEAYIPSPQYNLDDVISDIKSENVIPEESEPEEPEESIEPELKEPEIPELDGDELLEQIIGDFSDGTQFEGTKIFKTADDGSIELQTVIDENIESDEYASDIDFSKVEAEPEKKRTEKVSRRKPKSFREKVITPFISAAALIALKIQQSRVSLSDSIASEEDLGEEMTPDKASKFYSSHVDGLRIRTRIAFVLSLVLTYISYGLPVGGAMNDVAVKSAVCLVLLLSVMIVGLDIITSGIMSLVNRRPHANSLIAISALLCIIDAFIIAGGMKSEGLPFCAVPALTISFSLLGSTLNCRCNRMSFNTLSTSRKPYTVTAETSVSGDGITVMKSRINTKGFVRRAEEAGPDETVYGAMAPFLIVAVLVLSIIAAAVSKSFSAFAHILSGIFVCAAPIAMLITFPLPNFVSSKTLIRRGAAIAGWSGIYDIGKCQHMIITDYDLFSKENVKISRVRIFSGLKPEKVVSLAGSIISASGSVLTPAFADLMTKGRGTLLRVENFECHEGGGLVAMVDGVEVYCGSASFMHLMGVHLPEEYKFKDCIYVSEGAAICGMFEMSYTADESVREALYTLMASERHPIFAVRDFNITPQLLSVKFDMATDGFDFPTFAERYEISGAEPSENSKPAAVLAREGLGHFVDLAEHGKSLYTGIRICVLLSVLSTVIGILLMFILSLSGSLSVVMALTYLIIWLIPVIIISFIIKV